MLLLYAALVWVHGAISIPSNCNLLCHMNKLRIQLKRTESHNIRDPIFEWICFIQFVFSSVISLALSS